MKKLLLFLVLYFLPHAWAAEIPKIDLEKPNRNQMSLVDFNDFYNREIIFLLDIGDEYFPAKLEQVRQNFFNGLGPLTGTLLTAVYQSVCPIITTSTLWQNIVEYADLVNVIINDDQESVNKKYLNNPKYRSTLLSNKEDLEKITMFIQKAHAVYTKISNEHALHIQAAQVLSDQTDAQLLVEQKTDEEKSALKNNIMGSFENVYQEQYASIVEELKLKYPNELDSLWTFVGEIYKCFFTVRKAKKDGWDIRKISESLYLLLPFTYLQEIDVRIKKNEKKYNFKTHNLGFKVRERAISQEESLLGLKYQTLSVLQNPFTANTFSMLHTDDELIAKAKQFYADFIMNLRKVFIIKDDISSHKNEDLILLYHLLSWNIYCLGHGNECASTEERNYNVIGLDKNTFENFLLFLNKQVNTGLLFYTSCFAAGHRLKHIEELFKNDVLKYTLIVGATTMAVTRQSNPLFQIGEFNEGIFHVKLADEILEPQFNYDFRSYFKKLRSVNKAIGSFNHPLFTYGDAIRDILLLAQEDMYGYNVDVNNIPQIFLPYSNSFRFADSRHILSDALSPDPSKYIKYINQQVVELALSNNKPITVDLTYLLAFIPNRFNRTTNTYSLVVPNSIRFYDSEPFFVSTAPGNSEFYIDNLLANNVKASSFLVKVMGPIQNHYSTKYNIKNLNLGTRGFSEFFSKLLDLPYWKNGDDVLLNDNLVLQNVLIFSNAIYMGDEHKWGMVFTYQNKHYSMVSDSFTDFTLNPFNNLKETTHAASYTDEMKKPSGKFSELSNHVLQKSIPTIIRSYHSKKLYDQYWDYDESTWGPYDAWHRKLSQNQQQLISEYEKIKDNSQLLAKWIESFQPRERNALAGFHASFASWKENKIKQIKYEQSEPLRRNYFEFALKMQLLSSN